MIGSDEWDSAVEEATEQLFDELEAVAAEYDRVGHW
ncbi:hypothetical protein SAMN05443661_11519 [Natronobacterium gregoryi]|nr:hypothetical protein SAMN05443661_11519 [Natronobacterium gregoryi]